MDRVTERIAIARRALATLQEALREPETAMNRDACIQRFEYSFETAWKAAQLCLAEREGLALASPNGVIRASYRVGLLTEAQGQDALAMSRDRNLTVHTYNEDLAAEIYRRLPAHAKLLDAWLAALAG